MTNHPDRIDYDDAADQPSSSSFAHRVFKGLLDAGGAPALVGALRFGYDKRVSVGKVSRWIGAAIGWVVGHALWLLYLVVVLLVIGIHLIASKVFERLQREGPVDDGFMSAELKREVIDQNIADFGVLWCPYGEQNITRRMVNIDHIKPWIRGGSTEKCNLQVTCGFHNRQKGDKTHDEYEAWRWENRKEEDPCVA